MHPAAQIVIEKFGGAPRLAELLKVDKSRVYRWTYPIERGGTGGFIPSKHQMQLLQLAAEHGIPLSPNDFFATSNDGALMNHEAPPGTEAA